MKVSKLVHFRLSSADEAPGFRFQSIYVTDKILYILACKLKRQTRQNYYVLNIRKRQHAVIYMAWSDIKDTKRVVSAKP